MAEKKHEFLFPNGDRKWLTVEDGAKLDKPEGSLLILITATLFKELHDKADRECLDLYSSSLKN